MMARRQLEPTFSPDETATYLGCGHTRVSELIALGKQFKGVHPLRGGLYPTFKTSHKSRRIPESAIERHVQHMRRLDEDAVFAAQMRAKAENLPEWRYGRKEAA